MTLNDVQNLSPYSPHSFQCWPAPDYDHWLPAAETSTSLNGNNLQVMARYKSLLVVVAKGRIQEFSTGVGHMNYKFPSPAPPGHVMHARRVKFTMVINFDSVYITGLDIVNTAIITYNAYFKTSTRCFTPVRCKRVSDIRSKIRLAIQY